MTNERLKDYQSGVYESDGDYWRSTKRAICTCGHSFTTQMGQVACPECGGANFLKRTTLPVTRTTLYPLIEVIDKGDKHFHVKRTNMRCKISNGKISELIMGDSMDLHFNLAKREIKLIDKDGEDVSSSEEAFKQFFRNINDKASSFLKSISTERSYDLLYYSYDSLSKQYGERNYSIYRGLHRLLKTGNYFEILYFLGFKINTMKNVSVFINETKPHKILGVAKYMIPYLLKMNNLNQYVRDRMMKLHNSFGGNNTKLILQILDEESSISNISSLANDLISLKEEYKDIKRLMLYLCRDVKLQQGIMSPDDASTYLMDYIKMAKELDLEWEKYPKSLKKEHDIMTMNYRIVNSKESNESFDEVVNSEDYQRFTYKTKAYSIISPSKPDDLVREGKTLSHCIASYVNDVIKKRCKIFFARPTGDLDKSMLSIEVRDDKYIRQVKGKKNRVPLPEEKEFIQKWAEKVGLEVANY